MATHRYWRLNVTATDGTYVSFAEIELRESIGGADVTGAGTATASFNEAGNTPANAVDNNTTTKWGTYNQTPPQWWAYDFGAGNAFDIKAVLITPRQDGYYAESPKTFTIDYSDNGTDWTTAKSIVGYVWANATQRTFLVNDDFAPHDLTGDTSHAPFVVAASSESAGYESHEAFDGRFGEAWSGTGGGADWLSLDLGAGNSAVLGTYWVVAGPTANQAPKDWTMEGSNNNSTWATLDTVTGQTSWGAAEAREFTCDVQTTTYRYFRLNITDNNGDATYTQVAELYLYNKVVFTFSYGCFQGA